MRLFLSLAALGLAVSAGSAQAAQAQRKGVNWVSHVTQTTAGAYVIGNPAARVKLVEYVSYTCPHCAVFTTESAPVLKGQMVRSGSTSIEIRHFIRDRLDLAAALIARCGGAAKFAGLSDAIFAQQRDWLKRGMEFDQANGQRIAAYPAAAQMRAEADGSGLTAIGKSAGLSDAQITACLSDRAATDRIVAMTTAAPTRSRARRASSSTANRPWACFPGTSCCRCCAQAAPAKSFFSFGAYVDEVSPPPPRPSAGAGCLRWRQWRRQRQRPCRVAAARGCCACGPGLDPGRQQDRRGLCDGQPQCAHQAGRIWLAPVPGLRRVRAGGL
ncbi:hypothetical protein GCM10020258_07340 [Sphingomonas yabuuchiae]